MSEKGHVDKLVKLFSDGDKQKGVAIKHPQERDSRETLTREARETASVPQEVFCEKLDKTVTPMKGNDRSSNPYIVETGDIKPSYFDLEKVAQLYPASPNVRAAEKAKAFEKDDRKKGAEHLARAEEARRTDAGARESEAARRMMMTTQYSSSGASEPDPREKCHGKSEEAAEVDLCSSDERKDVMTSQSEVSRDGKDEMKHNEMAVEYVDPTSWIRTRENAEVEESPESSTEGEREEGQIEQGVHISKHAEKAPVELSNSASGDTSREHMTAVAAREGVESRTQGA